ncbi:MAG: argininosuccinate synthase [Planctomycetota bacterium]|nr:MAG: argininosuccinate synthase [Planctomycetota bacterium]
MDKVVLAYSGGLETSVCIHWLRYRKGLDVRTFSADLGQPLSAEELSRQALDLGAHGVFIRDLRQRFAEDFILPALMANAETETGIPLSVALSRPLITEELILIARSENCRYIAHGGSAKSNDQIRFQMTAAALAPDLRVLAPLREPELASRKSLIRYAQRHSLPITTAPKTTYDEDQNIWGRLITGEAVEDLAREAPEELFRMTRNPASAPPEGEEVVVGFDGGVPTTLNGKKMSLVELIEELNEVAGRNGVGRVDGLDTKIVGIKARYIAEAPAAKTLVFAHRRLECAVLPAELLRLKRHIERIYADVVHRGLWFSRLRRALQAFIDETQPPVTGRVRLRLRQGTVELCGVESDYTLYDADLATHSERDAFDHSAAAGFVDVLALEHRLEGMRERLLQARIVRRRS